MELVFGREFVLGGLKFRFFLYSMGAYNWDFKFYWESHILCDLGETMLVIGHELLGHSHILPTDL